MATRTDILRLRLEAQGDAQVRGALAGVGREGRQVSQRFGGIATAAKGAAAAIVTAFSIRGAVAALRATVAEAIKAEQSQARIAALIRATGQAAGLTQRQVLEMTESLEESTGVAGEKLEAAASILINFGNVTREVFGDALALANDIAVVFDRNIITTSTNLGRLLSDPITQINALSSAGVRFTDVQQAMIATLVRTGDVAGAQRLIIEQLTNRIGGAAVGQNIGLTKAVNDAEKAWGDFLEAIGRTETVSGGTQATLNTFARLLRLVREEIEKTRSSFEEEAGLVAPPLLRLDDGPRFPDFPGLEGLSPEEAEAQAQARLAQRNAARERQRTAARERQKALEEEADAIRTQIDPMFTRNAALEEFNRLHAEGALTDEELITARRLAQAQFDQAAGLDAGAKAEADFVKVREDILSDLQGATREAEVGLVRDARQAALARVQIAADEFRARIEFAEVEGEERRRLEAELAEFIVAQTTLAVDQTQTPMERLAEDWADTTQRMREATAGWLDGAAAGLTEFVTTGRINFRAFAESVIRDLVRIQIQQALAGIFVGGGLQLFSPAASTTFVPAAARGGVIGPEGVVPLRRYQSGGVADSPQLAVFGEGALPEAFVPLPDGRRIPVQLESEARGGNTFIIDARGADAAAARRIEAALQRLAGPGVTERRAIGAVAEQRLRGGRFAAAFE